MDKLDLSAEGRKIFEDALNEAYEAGFQNATFTMGSVHELATSQEDEVKKIVDEFVSI